MNEMKEFPCYYGQDIDQNMVDAQDKIELDENVENSIGYNTRLWSKKLNKYVTIVDHTISNSRKGGQGKVYNADDDRFVIKIYEGNERTKMLEQKLLEMSNYDCQIDGIVWVYDVLYLNNVFVGMLMKRVEGKPINILKLIKKKNFDRVKQVDMIIKILEMFEYLHSHNILVGDIKLENILLDDNFIPYLVDIDSIQIGQYPCKVGSPGYNSPEVILSQGEENIGKLTGDGNNIFMSYYSYKYRDITSEYYVLAILIYKIVMLADISPCYSMNFAKDKIQYPQYVFDGDDSVNKDLYLTSHNIFAFGETYAETTCTNINDTGKKLRTKWAHLPGFIKQVFCDTFHNNVRHSATDMLARFKRYKQILEDGELAAVDREYNAPVPKGDIDYSMVNIPLMTVRYANGFSTKHAMKKLVSKLKNFDKNLRDNIARELDKGNDCRANGVIFKMVYDIGVLKKIEAKGTIS